MHLKAAWMCISKLCVDVHLEAAWMCISKLCVDMHLEAVRGCAEDAGTLQRSSGGCGSIPCSLPVRYGEWSWRAASRMQQNFVRPPSP